MVILRGRDCILSCMGITDRSGERYKVGRWVGLGLWTVVVIFACIGGLFAEKIEMLGVVATLAIGWLLPCESSPSLLSHLLTRHSRLLHHHFPRQIATIDHLPFAPAASDVHPSNELGGRNAYPKQ